MIAAAGLWSAIASVLPPGAAQQSRMRVPLANEGRDELRGFILNCDLAGAEDGCLRDVTGLDAAGGCEKGSGAERNSLLIQLLFCGRRSEADCGRGNRLTVFADLVGGGESVVASPALHQPSGMGEGPGQGFS